MKAVLIFLSDFEDEYILRTSSIDPSRHLGMCMFLHLWNYLQTNKSR